MKLVYLPTKLDLESLVKEHPPTFNYHIEDFKYLIGLIVRFQVEIKANTEKKKDGYVPLYSPLMQSRIHNYKDCLEYLMAQGIVERDYYRPGKSFGYRLFHSYATSHYRIDNLTLKRLIKTDVKSADRKATLERDYGHLTKWFNANLQIDRTAAYKHLLKLYRSEVKQKGKRPLEKYYIRQLSVDRISKLIFSKSVDNTSHRFHSNLTNLKSDLRRFITYEGKRLCAVDIKNSQPFISIALFNPAFYTKTEEGFTLYAIDKVLFESVSESISSIVSLLPPSSLSIMLVKSHESEASNNVELYCTLVDKGRLYQYLTAEYYKQTGIHYDTGNDEQKARFKKLFFRSIYADNDMHHKDKHYPFRQVFIDCFPDVYEVFRLLKQKAKRTLAVILQSIEAEIVINRITRRIAFEHPDLPIFTIHDSVATVEEYTNYVKDIIKAEFAAAIGFEPSVDPQVWKPPKES